MLKSQHGGLRYILAVNVGSSSLKLMLFDATDNFKPAIRMVVENIGLPDTRVKIFNFVTSEENSTATDLTTHESLLQAATDWLKKQIDHRQIGAIGHRIVHGGPKYYQPTKITAEVIKDLLILKAFDPEHLPHQIKIVEKLQKMFPRIPQVACFDTAFHHPMPKVAQMMSLPRKLYDEGLRRYGFHGLAYSYLFAEMHHVAGPEAAHGKIIFAHLGSGASLAATKDGLPIDTTMGFSPASGIMMSTRSGDLDPGVVLYLDQIHNISVENFNTMVNKQSGLLGISESSADMYSLIQNMAHDEKAADAVELFCYQVKKAIGSLAAALGGVDTLVFSGGIAQNAPLIRQKACDGLQFLGIELDNAKNLGVEPVISSKNSKVTVRVMETNEELVIAKQVSLLITNTKIEVK